VQFIKSTTARVDFEGTALQLPAVAFKAVLTRIGD
jgi:hypothetical protein